MGLGGRERRFLERSYFLIARKEIHQGKAKNGNAGDW